MSIDYVRSKKLKIIFFAYSLLEMPNMIVFDKILNLRRKGASINDVQHKIKS